MPAIHRLSPELANQIAAGEVVERPASALKELVENSIDAGSRRIDVTVKGGGKRLIRVQDDGTGMSPEDAQLALERHATSKLSSLDDLMGLNTMGFRGEALPSIASVSHLSLRTKTSNAPYGIELRVDGGSVGTPSEVGMPNGTVVEVTELFYNVPARRKFLKSDGAESSQVSRTITQLALGHPEVGFSLTNGARRVLQYPQVRTLDERFFQVYGDREDLVKIEKRAAGVVIQGFAAALTRHGAARGAQNIFVNRRVIKDRTISHAVHDAYARATIKLRSPEIHLFIDLPSDQVDVNVHPMKAEVRFLEQSLIHELVRRAVGDALGEPASTPMPVGLHPTESSTSSNSPIPRSIPGITSGISPVSHWSTVTEVMRAARLQEVSASSQLSSRPAVKDLDKDAALDKSGPLMPLGQFRDTFIIAVDNEGVAIIDQHVAHERILFEQVMAQLSAGPVEGQRLLTPIVVDLAATQREALEARTVHLEQLGFEIRDFGGASIQIVTIPGLLERTEAESTVRELAADAEGFDAGAQVNDVIRRLAATTSCHAAVKANDRLTHDKMVYLLDGLRRTEFSTVCPHGRPVVLRLTRSEIENSFER